MKYYIFETNNDNILEFYERLIELNKCESCKDKGYLEVTHSDNCEYIEHCENCNGFTLGSHGDCTGANERAREQAIKDGYVLDNEGKIKE
jgi:hypothetical protein